MKEEQKVGFCLKNIKTTRDNLEDSATVGQMTVG
jgi:hypothetical protein